MIELTKTRDSAMGSYGHLVEAIKVLIITASIASNVHEIL